MAVASAQGRICKDLPVGDVEAHSTLVCDELKISAFRYARDAARKKPEPAMILELMELYGVSLADTVLVGDSTADQQAADAAGVRFVDADAFVSGGLGSSG